MNITLSYEQLDSIIEQMEGVLVPVSSIESQVSCLPEVDREGIKLRPCLFDDEEVFIGAGEETPLLDVIKDLCVHYYEPDHDAIEELVKDVMLSELREAIRYIEEYKG